MSTESSSFLSGRQIGDCRPQPDIVVYFDGSNTEEPLIEAGTLVFKGAKANVPNQGISVSGLANSAFKFSYGDIRPGGAGVKLRCLTNDTKQRIRFTVLNPKICGYKPDVFALQLRPVEYCGKAFEFDEEYPIHFFRRCGSLETDCQITEEAARLFNQDYSHLGTAYTIMETVNGVSVYGFDIETKEAGQSFSIEQHEGFSNPRIIIPGNKRNFTRSLARDFFKTAAFKPTIYDGSNDANLNVIELFGTIDVRTSFAGVATSDLGKDTTTSTKVPISIAVLFEINANANAQFAKIKSLLKGPGNNNGAGPYLSKMIDDTCADQQFYPYTLVRTDAGDPAAMLAVKTQYPEVKLIYRPGYMAGKSYYEIWTAADTIPVPTSAIPTDVLTKGNNQVPEPYTVSSCPAGTPCGDCPPTL
jgi:hypothetical protein